MKWISSIKQKFGDRLFVILRLYTYIANNFICTSLQTCNCSDSSAILNKNNFARLRFVQNM